MVVTIARELTSVANVTARLQALLDHARSLKPLSTVDPPLPISEIAGEVDALQDNQTQGHAVVETAARELFYALISSVGIQDPAFVEVWNLLDILLLCGDRGQCAPELVCWLIEELLDSQTTHSCRTVFDYLESRRERLARKDFHKKNLIFLRSCNELLRRLSRAEDAIFCGRVFFFLFQTFPLGDKSSVNLRGEFHVENTTKFEVQGSQPDQDGEKMEVDAEPAKGEAEASKASTPQPPTKPGSKAVPIKAPPKKEEEIVLSSDELYPIFWRLQQDFCEPTRLFASSNFQMFKNGLERTITKFKKTPTVVQTHAAEPGKRGRKRKMDENDMTSDTAMDENGSVDNYNPKYLTSRDLFDLELSDMAFQRHILVQALILIDFLLSLTEKAKKKIAGLDATNKSMLYNFTLSEDDSKWAVATRSNITNYLSSSGEGRLFNRMVETVLARDKNWVQWKVESCPTIVKEPVSTESELGARKGAREATRVRRLPDNPSTMDLSFLDEGSGGGLEALTAHSRYHVSPLDGLLKGIQTDELDLDFADTDVEKTNLRNAMANKRWRIVRQARARQLQLLDKIEPGKDLSAVFHPEQPSEAENEDAIEQVVGSDVDRAAAENGEYKSEEKITVTENGETIGLNVVVTSGEEEVRNAPVIGEQATVTGGDAEQQMEVEQSAI